MKKFIIILITMLVSSITMADDGVEIKMSDIQEAGHVIVKPSNESISVIVRN